MQPKFDPHHQLPLVAWPVGVALLMSILVGLLFPYDGEESKRKTPKCHSTLNSISIFTSQRKDAGCWVNKVVTSDDDAESCCLVRVTRKLQSCFSTEQSNFFKYLTLFVAFIGARTLLKWGPPLTPKNYTFIFKMIFS